MYYAQPEAAPSDPRREKLIMKTSEERNAVIRTDVAALR
jgi:hypothetical protein